MATLHPESEEGAFIHSVVAPLAGALTLLESVLEKSDKKEPLIEEDIEDLRQVFHCLKKMTALISARRDVLRNQKNGGEPS